MGIPFVERLQPLQERGGQEVCEQPAKALQLGFEEVEIETLLLPLWLLVEQVSLFTKHEAIRNSLLCIIRV